MSRVQSAAPKRSPMPAGPDPVVGELPEDVEQIEAARALG